MPVMRQRNRFFVALGLAIALGIGGSEVSAQTRLHKGPQPKSFQLNRDQPVRIQAATLVVRDKQKRATFSGSVVVIQGDTELRCDKLIVFYDNEKGKPAAKKSAPNSSGQQQIRRMEARGHVIVTQKGQTATGDRGDFEMRSNTVTLVGHVVVTRGQDVLRGQRLVVNLTTGVSTMDSRGGRVEGLFQSKPKGSKKSARTN